ncbi:MAG: tetratricopeptide repeat protein, partial [Bacteroidales bacterium]|nr:tetratricopeptide repeat protein [Bacteroidales bacterium]
MLNAILHGVCLFRHTNIFIFRSTVFVYAAVAAILCAAFPSSAHSQGKHTVSNRAMRLYNEGMVAYDYIDFQKAEIIFKEATQTDPRFYEAYMMLGELFFRQKRYAEAAENYRTAVKIDSMFYKPVFFNLAVSEMLSGDYSRALVHFKVYTEQKGVSEKNRITAAKNITDCEFALEAMAHPVSFNPVSVGAGINTADDEYWPSITADGHTMMFTKQATGTGNMHANPSQEDFYISVNHNGVWGEAFNAGHPVNTPQNEGAQALSAGGDYMFFTACNRPGGVGNCDIYFSSNSDGVWTQPYNIGPPVNTPHWDSQPSLSADGRMLFFSSSRPGGFGGKDIWYSVLDTGFRWQPPVNMGKNINTAGDEMSPFIHFDGHTLYFSSDGLTGMGGFDIYMTKMESDSSWTAPQNLGYPVNTYNDETGLVIESSGKRAFFSSVRDRASSKDIFCFDVDESIRPDPVSYLKGKVIDRETGGMIKAEYELINLTEKRIVMKSVTGGNGDFLVCLPSGFNYGINVSKNGYLFHSENFLLEGIHSVAEPYVKTILLTKIKTGEKIQLTNVFYTTDSWQIEEESFNELNNLVSLLTENIDIAM